MKMLRRTPPKTANRPRKRSSLRPQSRMPTDYCWQVFGLLLEALNDQLDVEFRKQAYRVFRTRDVAGYYGLESLCGLQCMATWKRPFRGDPASARLIGSVIRKHEAMSLKGPALRKRECLASVKTLDESLPVSRPSWTSDPVFLRMKRVLQEILGGTPTVEAIADSARHGPGSSLTHSFKERSSYFKYERWPYAVGRKARDLLIEVIKLDYRWLGALEQSYRSRYRIPAFRLLSRETFWRNVVHDEYQWNRVTTVPKDGTKDRPIAIEPAGNIFLQLGIEGVIRRRLKAVGVDLDSQEKNRRWCLKFSKENKGATLDLSNASDTISREFCRSVLPTEWFELLDSVRSPYGEFPDGTGWRYAKMSSMGNATTFVLESLLFFALSKAISEVFGAPDDRIAVFGDDLLIEDYLVRHHYIYLRECGFIPNLEKSFVSGPVRESCGVDAFEGIDIRPVFLKTQPTCDLDIYNDRNRLNRWFAIHHGCSNPAALDSYFSKYLSGELLLGPESDTEFDSYWHVSGFPAIPFRSIKRRVVQIPAKDLFFRKLMHNLRGLSEGGKFLVQEVAVGAISMVSRDPPYSCGYKAAGGVLLDHPKQPYLAQAE